MTNDNSCNSYNSYNSYNKNEIDNAEDEQLWILIDYQRDSNILGVSKSKDNALNIFHEYVSKKINTVINDLGNEILSERTANKMLDEMRINNVTSCWNIWFVILPIAPDTLLDLRIQTRKAIAQRFNDILSEFRSKEYLESRNKINCL